MTRDLEKLLAELERDESLLEPSQLGRRIEALDMLDAAEFDNAVLGKSKALTAVMLARAATIRNRLETANAWVYQSIRQSICQTGKPETLLRWINRCREVGGPTPGLGYDVLDELIAGVLELSEPGEVEPTSAEQVFYQPTPARHVLDMIERTGLSAEDMLVDFGSGLGQVCMQASMLTGAHAIGIEIEGRYVESARQCARNLSLEMRVKFIHADAREVDLAVGTVFHLYTPFTGSILRAVLEKLREQAGKRPICVTTLGPCADVVAQEKWLKSEIAPNTERITIFRS